MCCATCVDFARVEPSRVAWFRLKRARTARPRAREALAYNGAPGIDPARMRMTPIDFVLDELMLERPRMVSAEDIASYSLPFTAPFFCNDWATFVFQALSPDLFLRLDLRTLLLDQIAASACAYGAPARVLPDPVSARQLEVYGAMHAGLSAESPFQASPVASWEELVCLLAQAMDTASHVRQFLCTGPTGQGQVGLFVAMLAAVCAASRQLAWLACVSEGRGQVPESCFRVPHPDAAAYVPTALHPFGYDFLPFGALHGRDPAQAGLDARAPDGGSLFKHGPGGAGAPCDAPGPPPFPFESPAPAPAPPPIWDHALLLPTPPHPPAGGRCGPEAGVGGGAGPGGAPWEGQGWGGAGADARHASHFIPGGLGGPGAPDVGPGGPGAPCRPAEPQAHPADGGGDPCAVRWASVVRRPAPRTFDVVVDAWPALGGDRPAPDAVGQRRRRGDEWGDGWAGRRARC